MRKSLIAAALLGLFLANSALAQSLLPNGQQTFVDANGDPLAAGKVYFYVPNTTTAKFTYQDPGETTPNTNPVMLNSAGRAIIWGTGLYREVVYDQFGTLIWDQLTYGATQASTVNGTGPHIAVVTASGAFFTPTYTDESTVFKVCLAGGGGGSGGISSTANIASGGGGAGGGGCLWLYGFPSHSELDFVIGAAGTAGASGGAGRGGDGGDTTVAYSSTVFFTGPGGGGGTGSASGSEGGGSDAGIVSIGSLPLTEVSFLPAEGGFGGAGITAVFGGGGGSSMFQPGLQPNVSTCTLPAQYGLANGGGGGVGNLGSSGGCAAAGYAGQAGQATIEWTN